MEQIRVVNLEKRASKLEERVAGLEHREDLNISRTIRVENAAVAAYFWLLVLTGLVAYLFAIVVVGE